MLGGRITYCAIGGGRVLAPFASGGLDIRSRALAERAVACELLWEFVKGFDAGNTSYGASCDGLQGYFMARCFVHGEITAEPAASRPADRVPSANAAQDRRPKPSCAPRRCGLQRG
eukprot:4325486-Prymnesium_polylepis.1